MAWIQRNLILVIGAAAALLLLGAAGYYLYTQIEKDREVTQRLEERRRQWEQLERQNPHPNEANIQAASRDAERVKGFLRRTRNQFRPIEVPEVENSRDFRSLLETTIAGLTEKANQLGVALPPRYLFSFDPQMQTIDFAPEDLQTLTEQLVDIERICEILFDPRVHRLDHIRRVPVTEGDRARAGMFIKDEFETNEVAVLAPYEVEFRGFSSELAGVIEGFAQAPEGFMVKTVSVEPGRLPPTFEEPSSHGGRGSMSRGRGRSSSSSSRGSGSQQREQERRNREFQEDYGVSPGSSSRSRSGRGSRGSAQEAYEGYEFEDYGQGPGSRSRRQSSRREIYDPSRRSRSTESERDGLPEDLQQRPLRVTLLVETIKLRTEE